MQALGSPLSTIIPSCRVDYYSALLYPALLYPAVGWPLVLKRYDSWPWANGYDIFWKHLVIKVYVGAVECSAVKSTCYSSRGLKLFPSTHLGHLQPTVTPVSGDQHPLLASERTHQQLIVTRHIHTHKKPKPCVRYK